MSVSPFPPGPSPPHADQHTSMHTSSAAATTSYDSYPASSAAAHGQNVHEEPFSSAAAYRYSVSSAASPPPPTTLSTFGHSGPSNGAIAAAAHERASPLKSPPPASTLVIQEPTIPSSPSPGPTASTRHAPKRANVAAESRSTHSSKPDGTASISRSARSSATSWFYGSPDSFIRVPSRNAFLYILASTVEAVIVITLVAFIFARIVTRVDSFTQDLKTVSVYLAVFVFGAVFQVVISWDAVRLKNTMQLIGVLIFNVALTVTAAIEIRQVRDALDAQDRYGAGVQCADNSEQVCRADSLFPSVERYLIAVTAVCFVMEFVLAWLTFKLWQEFGWVIYQKIGADLRVRRMFFWYQLFIVFLKFSFFFGVGFTVIYLILVAQTTDWEYGVTVAAVPVAIVALFAAGFAVRREWTSLMVLSLVLMVAGLVYFVYKVTQVWVPATRDQYTYVHTTITFISGFAILALGLTLINGVVCLANFNKGLKPAHDAIGRFAGVHRQRARTDRGDGDAGGAVLDDGAEPKDGSNGDMAEHAASAIAVDPRRTSVVHSPVYNGYAPTTHPRLSVTQPMSPLYAPQPVPASLQPGLPGPPHTSPPPHHGLQQQHQVPTQAFLDAHQPRPTASRISLD